MKPLWVCRFLTGAMMCCITLGSPLEAPAQEVTTQDSLLQQLKAVEGPERVHVLNELSWEYLYSEPDKALRRGKEALALAQELEVEEEVGLSLRSIGNVHYIQGRRALALDYYLRGREIFETGGYERSLAETFANIGNIYHSQNDARTALSYYFKALNAFEELGFDADVAKCLNNIGQVHAAQENLPKAREYYARSAHLKEKIGDSLGLANTLNNMGNVLRKQNAFAEALDDYRRALTIYEEENHAFGVSAVLTNMGLVFNRQERYPQALEYLFRSERVKKELGLRHRLPSTYEEIGYAYRKQGNNVRALDYAMRSLRIAEETGSTRGVVDASKELAMIYSEIQDYRQAFIYHQQYSTAKDSVFSEEKAKLIAQMQARYDVEKKMREIEHLRQESRIQTLRARTTRGMLGGGLFAALLLAGLFFNRTRIKQKANRLLQEQKQKLQENRDVLQQTVEEKELLLKEIHHRVKNNLQVIASLLNLQVDELDEPDALAAMRDAQGRVQSMALIHQKLYREENLKEVDMQDYVEHLCRYVFQTYYSRDVTCSIEAQRISLDVDIAVPLGLIINELLANTLKHAFPEGEGEVLVELKERDGQQYTLAVSDNGVGLPVNSDAGYSGDGGIQTMGLALVRDLTQQLGGHLFVENGTGLTYTIHFKA